jgi:V/A-type H+-transporting ATPase subunit E
MSAQPDIDSLKAALMERAERLAEECLARGRQLRDRVIREETDRLRLREEREVLAAKAEADRLFRRRVQAHELRVEGKLDQLRWDLAQKVMGDLLDRLRTLAGDEQRYLPVLSKLLAHAAEHIEDEELIAALNSQDLQRLTPRWENLAKQAAPEKKIALDPMPCECTGGVRLQNKDGSIRVDNTFEGRIERSTEELYRAITERLFAQALHVEELVHG